ASGQARRSGRPARSPRGSVPVLSSNQLRPQAVIPWLRVRVEGYADARLIALVRLHVVLHPAWEEHEQAGARLQMNVRVPVRHRALDVAVQHAGAGIAERERA